jgi:hypothetical protein
VGTLLLALGGLLVVSTAVLLASCLRLRSAIGFLLAAYLFATAEVVLVSLALSPARLLTRTALLLVFGAGLAAALVVWTRRGRPSPPLRSLVPAARVALRDRAVLVLAMLAVITHLYLLVVAVAIPQSSPDTQLYHLPRAALWKQQHAVAYVLDVPDERVDASPPVAEIQIAATMILSDRDRYSTFVQLSGVLAACLGIAGIARRLGLGVAEAAFGAVAFSTYTIVVLQTPTALNDLAVAGPLVACAYFAIRPERVDLVLAALALALAVGTKLTTVLVLPVLVAFVLAANRRRTWPALGVAGIAGLVGGSVWYYVNFVVTAKPDGGLSDAFPQIADRSLGPTLERVGMLSRDFLEMSGAEGGGWLRSPTPGVIAALALLVVSGAFFLARRRRAAAAAALAAASTVVLYPMLATWVVVAGRAARQVLVTARLSDAAPARRVPLQFYESNIHSAYGIAFLVLFIWVGAIVIRDVTRRRLPLAAAVAIASPLLFILILALSLEYDPIRIRFVAFPVALATAVLGICVRIRPLAWGAVGLTAATLVILAAYFIPRPAGVALLPENRNPESSARWFVQAGGGGGDEAAFRFLEERVPADASVALDLVRNTYIYPAWDSRLRRTVSFVPKTGVVPDDATWLVVGPYKEVDADRLRKAGWKLELVSPRQWRIYGR